MSAWEGLISPLSNLFQKVLGRRMPVTKEQIGPYEKFREELTYLYRAFRIVRGISPARDREKFDTRYQHFYDANSHFYTELTETRLILDESHINVFDELVNETFQYLTLLKNLKGIKVEDERSIRKSHLNELEEWLDIRFIEAEYTIRRFLLGFSFKAWWEMRKIKSRRK